MTDHVARDSMTAWERLCEAGGIELHGRDEDFEEQLRVALLPSAATLNDALRAGSTDDLVRAFFGLAEPYVAMFRAIVAFFQAAGAREGQSEWAIRIDDEHLDLAHFQKFLEYWDAVEGEFDVPAIDSDGAWAVHRASQDVKELEQPRGLLSRGERSPVGLHDVDSWIEAYEHGIYRPFPASLHPERVLPELADAAAVTMAMVSTIRRLWPDRDTMLKEHRARGYAIDQADGFSPRTIAQHETDFQLRNTVVYLGRYASLEEAARAAFAQKLTTEYAPYPRRKIGVRVELPELERILSLPLWQKRHELYAVWIATEIVNALDDHECELHHEAGKITFAFQETVVTTVHSAFPKVKLYAERRSPLAAPIGHGRTGNVQPDYGLWRDSGGHETCGLVIEVKHYKRHSSRFREVMVDYARAHRDAKIVLVSHGPAREYFHDADRDVRDRCSAIGSLTASNLAERDNVRKIVRDYVKGPVPRGGGSASAVLIDVSLSMTPALDSEDLSTMLMGVVGNNAVKTVLADNQVRKLCTLREALPALRTVPRGNSTSLRAPVLKLLDEHSRLLVVTDPDGSRDLDGLTAERLKSQQIGSVTVEILLIGRD